MTLALLAILFLSFTGTAAAGVPSNVQVISEVDYAERVVELTIETPAFASATKVHVILPSGYRSNPSRRWPVTYFTAGTQNRYDAFVEGLGGTDLAASYPSIIVSPDANAGYWSDWFNEGSFGAPKYETFVIEHLIPIIDRRFRTVPKRTHRAIFGISMGGYGAMMLAARHPHLFSAAASLSGAVDSNIEPNGTVLSFSSTLDGAGYDAIYGPRATEEIRWRGHNPWDLAANLRGLDLQIRSANGTLNPAIGEGGDPNDTLSCFVEEGTWNASVSLHQKMKALRLPHAWVDYGAGCHSLQNFRREVIDTLARFKKVFAKPPSAPKTFDFRSIEPRFDAWGWSVRADRKRALEFLRVKTYRRGVILTGSGRTRVTTPPRYRGAGKVRVNGRAIRPSRNGRLTFTVDLGPPHAVQQYRPGYSKKLETVRVSLVAITR